MKRLIRKAYGKKLYHGTNWAGLEAITSSGMIMPQEGLGAGLFGFGFGNNRERMDEEGKDYVDKKNKDFQGYVFLGTTIDKSLDYAYDEKNPDAPIVILEVDIAEDALMPDDIDDPKAKTWKDSATSIGQVKVLGPVTSDYIRRVHFYNPHTEERVLIANFSNWKEEYEKNKDKFDEDYENGGELNEEMQAYLKEINNGTVNIQNGFGFNTSIKQYFQIYTKYFSSLPGSHGIIMDSGDIQFTIKSVSGPFNSNGLLFNYMFKINKVEIMENINSVYKVYTQNQNVINNMMVTFEDATITFVSGESYTVDQIQNDFQQRSANDAN